MNFILNLEAYTGANTGILTNHTGYDLKKVTILSV